MTDQLRNSELQTGTDQYNQNGHELEEPTSSGQGPYTPIPQTFIGAEYDMSSLTHQA